MKAFWIFIAMLVAATVVVFVADPLAGQASGPRTAIEPAQTASNRELERAGVAAAVSEPTPVSIQPSEAQADSPLSRRVRTDHEHAKPAAPGEPSANPFAFLDTLLGAPASTEVGEDTRVKDEASKTARVTQLPGGGIELDERFTLRGKGSVGDPFELSWDLLMSAREVYVPRDGRDIIPGRVSMLHETRVRLTGYLMLPTVRDKVDEFVVMQNQWDGCCIGIPPTPYDSVEVNLTEPMDFGLTGRQYATITGRLVVDPYLFGSGMLIGLYTIEDASVEVTAW